MDSSSDVHKEDCCLKSLSEEELTILDMSVDDSYDLNETEKASLFYIAKKEGIDQLGSEKQCALKQSEFLKLLSRGKLKFPSEELYNLSVALFCYFRAVPDKSSRTHLL